MTIPRELRARAEDAVRMTRRDVAELPTQDIQRLVFELQVHQIEIEMQNESLRSAQRDIERSREEYQELFDCAPAAYLLLDATGAIVRANAAAVMLLGEAGPRVIGRQLNAFIAESDATNLKDHLDSAQWNTRALCELRLRRRVNGTQVHVRMDTSVMPSLAADCLIVLTDISERRQSLEALQQLNDQLEARVAARTAELEARNRELEAESLARARGDAHSRTLETKLLAAQRLGSLGTLAAGIAHDFNNLLVSVLGTSDLMLLGPELPQHLVEPLTQIQQAGRRAADLTRQLLMFAGRGRPILDPVNLQLIAADGVELVRSRASGRIQLQTQVNGDVPTIEADRGQLHRAVMHLLTNAIEAIDGSGAILVHTQIQRLDASALAEFQSQGDAVPGDYAVLRVQDSGSGIPEEIVSRIFDPFFTTKFTGRGLGLSEVLGIVQSHLGAVRVRTPVGGGTIVEIALPIAASSRHVSERPRPLVEADWSATGSVLLIDDDDAVRRVVAQLLTLLGFDVTAANDGEYGLELFDRTDPPFDLVVCDWQMPGMSGDQVLKTLRGLDPELPMILISGYSAEDLAADDPHLVRLQKPMTLPQLRTAVRAVIGDAPRTQRRMSGSRR